MGNNILRAFFICNFDEFFGYISMIIVIIILD